MKNRNRSQYSFANINLLDNCNLDCFFCLGKDLESEFSKFKCLQIHYKDWPQLNKYIDLVRKLNVRQIYITGQNTDPLLYKYLCGLMTYLRKQGFYVGLRTNGLLAIQNIDVINQCTTCMGDAVAYTVLSRNKECFQKIVNKKINIPDWPTIFNKTNVSFRASIVVTRYNEDEISDLLLFLTNGNFRRPKYIQIRRISTDYRQAELLIDQVAYDRIKQKFQTDYEFCGCYESAPYTYINGIQVVFWETVNTTANSLNYFTNRVISKEYFLIEGYQKNKFSYADEKD